MIFFFLSHRNSPKFFHKKKDGMYKAKSLSTGIAQLALSTTYQMAATTGVGGYGVEEMIRNTLRQGIFLFINEYRVPNLPVGN